MFTITPQNLQSLRARIAKNKANLVTLIQNRIAGDNPIKAIVTGGSMMVANCAASDAVDEAMGLLNDPQGLEAWCTENAPMLSAYGDIFTPELESNLADSAAELRQQTPVPVNTDRVRG